MPDAQNPERQNSSPEEDEDSYFEGPYLVFTEAYHLKRGYCCQSGCRHCPYGFDKSRPEFSATPERETKKVSPARSGSV